MFKARSESSQLILVCSGHPEREAWAPPSRLCPVARGAGTRGVAAGGVEAPGGWRPWGSGRPRGGSSRPRPAGDEKKFVATFPPAPVQRGLLPQIVPPPALRLAGSSPPAPPPALRYAGIGWRAWRGSAPGAVCEWGRLGGGAPRRARAYMGVFFGPGAEREGRNRTAAPDAQPAAAPVGSGAQPSHGDDRASNWILKVT